MLHLPNVTLVLIETLEHDLGRLAINDCVTKAKFGDVLILTDKPEKFRSLDCEARFVEVPNWPNKIGWSRASWYEVPPHVRTSQTLYIQWDAWIWCPEMWRDEFLEYDIVGSCWWYPDRNVGNLGFGLRSTRLIRYVAKHRDKYPCVTDVDDDLLCRKYRPLLEQEGFVWAPERIARDFAFECVRPSPDSKHFGFHACQNFGVVLDHDRLLERARLMRDSEYIGKRPKSYLWENFCKAHPAVVAEL